MCAFDVALSRLATVVVAGVLAEARTRRELSSQSSRFFFRGFFALLGGDLPSSIDYAIFLQGRYLRFRGAMMAPERVSLSKVGDASVCRVRSSRVCGKSLLTCNCAVHPEITRKLLAPQLGDPHRPG